MFQNKFLKGSALLAFLVVLGFTSVIESDAYAQTQSQGPRFVAPRFTNNSNDDRRTAPFVNSAQPSENEDVSDEIDALLNSDLEEPEIIVEEDDEELLDADLTGTEPASASVDATSLRGGNTVEREPYDVYKENGQYFIDWEKPDVALVFTGMTNGYIEPCGCAGMERMKGGLSRRQTFLNELKKEMGWDVVSIDSGHITSGFGVQEELKFDMAMNAFHLMEYDAIGIGKGELRFPAYFLLTYTTPTSSTSPSLFTSANIGVYGYHPTYTLPLKIVERNGKKIGVVSVVCRDETFGQLDENLLYEDPAKKLAELEPELKKEKCDANVLIVHGTEEETEALAKKFPIFNYVLTSDTPSEPPAELHTINGDQGLIEVGEKGKYAIVLGLYDDGSVRYQRVALDSRYSSSPEITLLMKDYQSILRSLITTKGYRSGLGVNPAKSPNADVLGKYVGTKKCQSCHEDEWRVWAKSKHATAWRSLTDTANPPRNFDPECIGCHVTGWNGIQGVPYADGYESEEKTPELLNVNCESCHGPGERHIAAELDANEAVQKRIRSMMHLGDDVRKMCYTCHDGDNSPEFDFDIYYPLIAHESDEEDE